MEDYEEEFKRLHQEDIPEFCNIDSEIETEE